MKNKYFKTFYFVFLFMLFGCSSSDYELVNNGPLSGTMWEMTEMNVLSEEGNVEMKLDVYGYQKMLFFKHGGVLSVSEHKEGSEQYTVKFDSNLSEDVLCIKYEESNEKVKGIVNLRENRISIRYKVGTLKGSHREETQSESDLPNNYYEEVYRKVQSYKE
ncbi:MULTISPECIES: hypothetical protein [Myroides]|uniref:Lipoprotein n=1 Tax=Myroides albus TaxID=2562892 RepID=A0A6I3LP85_9FLAO|nr:MULTISPECIES: hypothetical protein [Myroides]MTG97785.1 hypothetical protein [Myroides albus]MVX34883.1 hypothetical protein [Myroides sp. LoEW2-1]UVD79742.1 hypothetical protein NWE55_00155 [Myroides albus]